MGYDLSATLGYGVCIQEFEEDSILTTEERDIVEDLYGTDSPVYIEYSGTDACSSVYVLHKNSIFGGDWTGSEIDSDDLMNCVRSELILGSELQTELLKNDIVISGEHFKWWILPRWF